MESVAGAEEGGVEEDLVGFAKGEVQLVGGHDFAVLFGAFGAHRGCSWVEGKGAVRVLVGYELSRLQGCDDGCGEVVK